MPHFTPIHYSSEDGLTLYARDYAPVDTAAVDTAAVDTAAVDTAAAGASMAGTPAAASPAARLPVICIHGLTRNCADFDEFAPLVAGLGRRVLALDVRGRGHSARDPNPDNYNPQVYAADVERLMAGLGIARAIFVGTSMGGLITMTLATRDIGLIAAAVLNDIGPVVSDKGLARIAGYTGKPVRPASWDDAARYVSDINRCAFPHNPDAEWDKWARRAFEPDAGGRLAPRYDPHIAIALQSGKLRPTSLQSRMAFRRLARERPLLLVRGALSDLLEARQAEWMRRAAPSMRYVEVPDVGHAPMLTEPAALAAVTAFLAGLP
ncbi:alpha/beta fold hydrolase [Massilia forsythiae]|uniref:alpha/beta fold hydrolase n=1 Tax=Massilia forsythiae TaxID=2728020 RepID=UPI001E4B718F|nr:alpha/beta hydrolase [Massilia forsythiae]